jgi:prepilin-type N-terminal cleavage/methylation domain-containing protein
MKRLCAKAGRAFTLIELLVVIAILAQNTPLRLHRENHR